ncbi:MAG: ankyrin repeat domain-containing protein [Chthoniobacteraceae bacterium]
MHLFFKRLCCSAILRGAIILPAGLVWNSHALCGVNPAASGIREKLKQQQAFLKAAATGNVEQVKALLKIDPALVFCTEMTKEGTGITPLYRAAQFGHREVAELLLANKADVNARDHQDNTPLHEAAAGGHLDLAELLLASKADVNARAHDGGTPLHMARDKDMIKFLLAHGAGINAKDNGNETLLDRVAAAGQRELVDFLVADGADFTIYAAVVLDDLEKAKELLKNDPSLVSSKANSKTPLHWAAALHRADMAELLLANKADVNAKDDFFGETPLHLAVKEDTRDVVSEDPSHKPEDYTSVAKVLLAHHANVDARDNARYTPLHAAADNYHGAEAAELLLQNNADVNARDDGGMTPLHRTTIMGTREVMKVLFAHKADLDARADDGMTPLYVAVEYAQDDRATGATNMAELLLAAGADANAGIREGTPLHLAMKNHNNAMVKLLRRYGAHE